MRASLLAGLATLVWAVAPAGVQGAPDAARRADSAHVARRPIAVGRVAADDPGLHLGRAALERSLGNLRGVVQHLERIDYPAGPSFAEADRAAFLLGQAYLELGAHERFLALARAVSAWPRPTHYTRWLAFQRALLETRAPVEAGAALPLIAAIERRGEGSALATYLEAQALATGGGDPWPAWTRLAEADTGSRLSRDLAGAARIRLATRALESGQDPAPHLTRVPAGSRYASRALHMAGLAALERGETGEGVRILTSLLAGDPHYEARREVRLALAGLALDRGRWDEAHATYLEVERDRAAHRVTLERLQAADSFDSLWTGWESDPSLSPALVLDGAAAATLAGRLALASQDLTARPPGEPPAPEAVPRAAASPFAVPPPAPEVREALAVLERQVGETDWALEHTRWATVCEQETLEARRRYLAGGLERARREAADLEARVALLDSLRATLAALDARLQAVRDEATRRILVRTAALLEDCIDALVWMDALRHFHLEGPERLRALPPPAGHPAPDSVLAAEEALARAIRDLAARLAAEGPDLIARSYQRAWRPGLIGRVLEQDSLARGTLARARALAASIDASIAANATSATLRLLAARSDSLARAADSLRLAHRLLRDEAARGALARTLEGLEAEREAIDYGLAASAYALGVRLARPDGAVTGPAAGPGVGDGSPPAPSPAPATAHAVSPPAPGARDTLDDAQAVRWRGEAIAFHRAFLERHAGSPARGETRFRLADLLLVEARREFREQMADYMGDPAAGGAAGRALPVLSHEPALALYRAILAEDQGFEHRDAVLFNAGMILAEGGDPEAERMFATLIEVHPGSPYVQEATLRMGDMHFHRRDYAGSIALYQRAAAGPDAGLTAVALYKTGWAHFNQDRFPEAAGAFAAVLDLYGSGRRAEIQVDVEGEAETYLVHSLAGAGGADAYARHFDATGPRPYAIRVLLSLGQHFRRFGLYPPAVASDRLFIARHPTHPDALLSARRMVDTHQRAEQPARVREARLETAARFAPGTEWSRAQDSDSVRTAGSDFARASWTAVAQEHHRRAREARAPEDWRAALGLYEQVLATWPRDPEAPALALQAGEAAGALGEHARALAHYGLAARTGPDSITTVALWQRVAVTDAWYESTRGGARGGQAATGSDSLAREVLAAAETLLDRYPGHPQAADLLWRQGNLSVAHGWHEEAWRPFARLVERHPEDSRAPRAAIQRADVLFRAGRFEDAGGAYEQALAVGRRAGSDSLVRRAAAAIPVAYHRHAEAAVAEDSTRHARHAALFERVATGWPRYEHAHLAWYRAGLTWLRAGRPRDGARALQAVIDSFPRSEYVRDAHLEIAKAWEAAGEKERSAEAHTRFAERYPADPGAADAWLKAADLFVAAGQEPRAEALRLDYIRRYPDDVESAMEILEALARRDLDGLGDARPVSSLLATPKTGAGGTPSHLAEYLRRAARRPDLASLELLARTDFLRGEEARPGYEALALRLPLPRSIAAKQQSLDRLIELYRKSAGHGVPAWAHAASFRIGEALIGFGEALERSERPADLEGDALRAYEAVLRERGREFADRGEGVWTELLREKGAEAKGDPWLARAQEALWQRLGDRFWFRPEMEYPLVAAQPVEKRRSESPAPAPKPGGGDAKETGTGRQGDR